MCDVACIHGEGVTLRVFAEKEATKRRNKCRTDVTSPRNAENFLYILNELGFNKKYMCVVERNCEKMHLMNKIGTNHAELSHPT